MMSIKNAGSFYEFIQVLEEMKFQRRWSFRVSEMEIFAKLLTAYRKTLCVWYLGRF